MEDKTTVQNWIKEEERRQKSKRMILSTAEPAKYMVNDLLNEKERRTQDSVIVKNHFSSFRQHTDG